MIKRHIGNLRINYVNVYALAGRVQIVISPVEWVFLLVDAVQALALT